MLPTSHSLRRFLAGCFMLLFLALGACRDEMLTSPVEPADASRKAATASADSLSDRDDPERPEEWRATRFAREIPGFGGHFVDEQGNHVAYLTNTANPAAVQAAREKLLPLAAEFNLPGRAGGVIVRQGEFNFLQLRRWRDRVSLALLATDGVTFVDVDEQVNRLVIGIGRSRSDTRDRVWSILAARGVPSSAARTVTTSTISTQVCEVTDPTCTDPCYNNPTLPECGGGGTDCTADSTQPGCEDHESPCIDDTTLPECGGDSEPLYSTSGDPLTLSDRVRPMRGGTRFIGPGTYGAPPTDSIPCTLGLAAKYFGRPVFIIASHCTRRMAHVQADSRFYQGPPGVYGEAESFMGNEYRDPAWSISGFASVKLTDQYGTRTYECNDDNGTVHGDYNTAGTMYCRRSDMALIDASSIPLSRISFGRIARTARRDTTGLRSGSATINPLSSSFKVTRDAGGGLPQGIRVNKMGYRTGWTAGRMRRNCVDRRLPTSSFDENPPNVALRCQGLVRLYSFGGDSGSPIFFWSGSGSEARFHGILSGGGLSEDGDPRNFIWYTPSDLIRLDLGIAVGSQELQTVF